MMDARTHLWLLNHFVHGSSLESLPAGGSSRSSRLGHLRFMSTRPSGALGSASHRVTARKKRKRGLLGRLHLGKLLHLAAPFIPGVGPVISQVL